MELASKPAGGVADMPISLKTLLTKARPGTPLVMGILNVTPDSFSDGGRFLTPESAQAQARRMAEEGADIIDVGAESTRPYTGATPTSFDDEMTRLKPVLPAVAALGLPVSIDTIKPRVADWALTNGATILNDVWGLQRDTEMARVAAAHGVPVIIMHNRDKVDESINIIAEMNEFFARSLDVAEKAKIAREQIVLDPGIGFGKTPEQSMTAIARLSELRHFGLPLLLGASRKRFIDKVIPSPPDRRVPGSLAAHLIGAQQGAAIIRAHDVAETVQALRVRAAIEATR